MEEQEIKTTPCIGEIKIRKFRRSDQQQCMRLFRICRTVFGSSVSHYWLVYRKYLQCSVVFGFIAVLPASVYSLWIILLYLFLVCVYAMVALFKVKEMKRRHKQRIMDSLHGELSDIEKHFMNQEGSCMWVADLEGEIVGMVGLRRTENLEQGEIKLRAMMVASRYRRQGIAAKLMKEALFSARRHSYRKVTLEASDFRGPAAINFYQKQGFTLVNAGPSFKLTRLPLVAEKQTFKFELQLQQS